MWGISVTLIFLPFKDMQWTKIYFANDELDANLVKGFLQSKGIEVKVVPKSAGMVVKSPYFYTNSTIPYELFVPENQQAQAIKILDNDN